MKVSIVSILMGILCTFSAQAPNPSVEDTTGLTETTISETTISANTEKDPQLSLDSSPGSSANINKGDNSKKNQTPEISYNQWKEENERKLEEKIEEKRREDQDRANNDLMRNIQSVLSRPSLPASKQAELNYVNNLLTKAAVSKDASIKKAAYDEALDVLVGVLSA